MSNTLEQTIESAFPYRERTAGFELLRMITLNTIKTRKAQCSYSLCEHVLETRIGNGMSKRKPTFISLFSGCGGFDFGFQQSGFQSLGAFDIDPDAVAVHAANLHGKCHIVDLRTASIRQAEFGRPDVVISGSPCQGFSNLGNRFSSDPRNTLLWRGAEIAAGLGLGC